MKRFAFLTTIFSIVVLSITLQAEGIFCGFDPEEPMASIPRDELFGECKVLVIVATCPEDIDSGWTTLDLPQWLTDSFIAPTVSDVNTAQYKWSLSNFWAAASGEQYWHVGEVNDTFDQYFVSDNVLAYYDSTGDSMVINYPTPASYIKHILIKADSVIDFSKYDYWPNGAGDGVVDYICIILPRDPVHNWPFNRQCYGYPGIAIDTVFDGVELTSERGFHNGCTATTPANGYARDPMVNLAAHEQGHNLSNYQLVDWYDTGSPIEMVDTDNDSIKDSITQYHNLYAASSPLGWYSIMNLAGQPHASMYSAPEMAKLPWADVTVVEENLQNVELDDMLDGLEILKVPISSTEAFYISSHLHTSSKYKHWEELMSDSGVLIWHEKLTFSPGYYPGASASELASQLDLECAGGKWDSSGVDTTGTPSPELGWDRLNQYVGFAPSWMQWNTNHGGAATSSDDFFREGYKTAFHTLTNPSSDAYNSVNEQYTYPASSYSNYPWREWTESAYRQNIATHIGIEGIHDSTSGSVGVCIRRSRIWTDSSLAMDRTTQRKLIYDSNRDTLHFIYPSKGYVYYTQSYDPTKRWYTADLLGRGQWPAIALDQNRQAIAVWYDDSKEQYNYHDNYERWNYGEDETVTLDLSGEPGPVAIDYGYGTLGGIVNPGGTDVSNPPGGGSGPGTVHLAYINDDNELHYARFFKTTPENLVDTCLDANIDESSRVTGTSIDIDTVQNKVCIAYGCVKDDTAASYYFEKNNTGWHGPYRLPSSISDSTDEPLVPFVDADSLLHRVVFNANGKVYAVAKARSYSYNNWPACTLITQMSGNNRYPQIAGTRVTWTNYVTTDSSNVWARSFSGSAFRLDTAYSGKSYFAHTTKVGSGSAQLYQHGIFSGPKWAIYYRDPTGFGGNQENEGEPVVFIPKEPIFKMSIPNNILAGSRLSIFTTGGDCMITVYDVSGRQVARQELKGVQKLAKVETPVDCDGWAKGVYFVRAVPKDGKVATSKVVLVR